MKQLIVLDLDDLRQILREAVSATGVPAAAAPAAPEYLTTRQAAALLGVSAKGLEAMRARGEGPPFIRVGRKVRYVASALRSK